MATSDTTTVRTVPPDPARSSRPASPDAVPATVSLTGRDRLFGTVSAAPGSAVAGTATDLLTGRARRLLTTSAARAAAWSAAISAADRRPTAAGAMGGGGAAGGASSRAMGRVAPIQPARRGPDAPPACGGATAPLPPAVDAAPSPPPSVEDAGDGLPDLGALSWLAISYVPGRTRIPDLPGTSATEGEVNPTVFAPK